MSSIRQYYQQQLHSPEYTDALYWVRRSLGPHNLSLRVEASSRLPALCVCMHVPTCAYARLYTHQRARLYACKSVHMRDFIQVTFRFLYSCLFLRAKDLLANSAGTPSHGLCPLFFPNTVVLALGAITGRCLNSFEASPHPGLGWHALHSEPGCTAAGIRGMGEEEPSTAKRRRLKSGIYSPLLIPSSFVKAHLYTIKACVSMELDRLTG